jgi:hypothetical protein
MKTVIKHIGSRNNVKATVQILRRGIGPFEYKEEGELISVEKTAVTFAETLGNAYQVKISSRGGL